MEIPRSSGVILHPTSLPGPLGVGELGAAAHRFIDVLAEQGIRWWQILPLNPPDPGGSPYSSKSAFASDVTLIDFNDLVDRGLLKTSDFQPLHEALEGEADDEYLVEVIMPLRRQILAKGYGKFKGSKSFDSFCTEEAYWLDDYALFSALKYENEGRHWAEWPKALVQRKPKALADATTRLADGIKQIKFEQWLFNEQWTKLKAYAATKGVGIIGDIPIFVAFDSSDVWANREYFDVDIDGNATAVAGVPPDYFSKTGQLWGNPLYDWNALAEDNYSWWFDRIRRVLGQVDMIRIDHFRGFESYWAVPAGAPNAIKGEWRSGPKDAFFDAVRAEFGELPFIAEDLGIITDEVIALRDRQHLPGMKVMHFAFDGGDDHPFLPHTYPENCVAYLGTHDNDTTMGWYWNASDKLRHRVRTYLSAPDEDVLEQLIRALARSSARLVVYTAQDVFGLGTECRTNTPGTSEGNWRWRLTQEQLNDQGAWSAVGDVIQQYTRAHA